jgi:hypothetical protein
MNINDLVNGNGRHIEFSVGNAKLYLTSEKGVVHISNQGSKTNTFTISDNIIGLNGDVTVSKDITLTKGKINSTQGNLSLTEGNTTLTEGNLILTKSELTLSEGDLTLTDSKFKGGKTIVSTVNLAPKVTDSGSIFTISASAEAIVLPLCSATDIGTNFTFVWPVANGNSITTITTGDTTDSTGDVFIGGLHVHSAAAINTYAVAGANISQLKFQDNLSNAACGAGSHVKCTMISATQWFIEGAINGTADTDGTGAGMFVNSGSGGLGGPGIG